MIREKIRVVFAFTLIAIGIIGIYQRLYERGLPVGLNFGIFDSMDYLLIGGSILLVIAGLASFKRWGWYSREAFAAIALSIIPTLILTQATFAVPIQLDRFLKRYGQAFMVWLFGTPLVYAPFAILLGLIIVGFLVKKGKLSILGSTSLYLSIFGHLYFSMWGIFGISSLVTLLIPIYEFCPQVLGLGNIVLLPHLLPRHLLHPPIAALWMNMYYSWLYVIVILGIAILFLGTTTWLYGKFKKYEIIDFGIYRYTRHPQYLGLLLWSYGLLLILTYYTYDILPRPSLPWLILALIIIGVALQEESGMAKKYGKKYLEYRNTTPFLLPLPQQFSKLIRAPVKAIFKKDWPENRKEIACTILIYGMILILLSVLITYLVEDLSYFHYSS